MSVIHFPFSDHDSVVLKIDLSNCINGPGVWKMNARTIQTDVFRKMLEKVANLGA